MLDKLGQLKDLWKMKKRLDAMVIKSQGPKHWVEITMNGSMEVKEVVVSAQGKQASERELGEEIKQAFNKAIRDTQMMAAQSLGNSFGIPNA